MTLTTDAQRIAAELNADSKQVSAVIELLDDGNTVPFITRYRKHRTGGLDETQIRTIEIRVQELRATDNERSRMLQAIEEQGKLTPELRTQFEHADSKKRLDELFAPFRSKRRTRADEALERGLGPLADAVWTGRVPDTDLNRVAGNCVGKHPDLVDVAIVLSGTADILAARIAENVAIRDAIRQVARQTGWITTKLVKNSKDTETFQDYAQFESRIVKLPPHRTLAIDRGEAKKALRVKLNWDDARALAQSAAILKLGTHRTKEFLRTCLEDALKRLVNSAIEREIRRDLTERAHAHAVEVFSRNLRSLLMQPPLRKQRVLAIDPGYRSGCKIVVLDEDGRVQANDLVYVIGDKQQVNQAVKLADLVREHRVEVIAIGNGTASRETEQLVAQAISDHDLSCRYTIVNEAGASIYSASDVGREEFPEFDATVRGTISIGRRLQDPLSELVKIEPQHIGVGMYQHDLSESQLASSLGTVVESCVNNVGVDLNRASVELLKYVSGLKRSTARNIVAWRETHGRFTSREQLKQVEGIGEVTFTQAAGFLRIADGEQPLDATWIHPESYAKAQQLLVKFAIDPQSLRGSGIVGPLRKQLESTSPEQLSAELQLDCLTAEQLVESLLKPGRDPRDDVQGPLFRSSVLSFTDLKPGMQLHGVVTNVVDFGAFVDVGLKTDGLVHISKMSETFVASPFDVVNVGDVLTVWVDSLDEQRRRVGLSMIRTTAVP